MSAGTELRCRYCGRRCFVLRTMPADSLHYAGKDVLLATCPDGMEHDRASLGHDHHTAFDPRGSWPPGPPEAAPSGTAGGALPHLDEPPAAGAEQPQAQPCDVCGLPVTAAYVAKTGRALHGSCSTTRPHPDRETVDA